MKRVCLGYRCNVLVDAPASRCARHARKKAHDTARYDSREWRSLRARVVGQWLEDHGSWCPGWDRPGHPVRETSDLCVDHDLLPGKEVLCRECNGRKGGGWDKARRRAERAAASRGIVEGPTSGGTVPR